MEKNPNSLMTEDNTAKNKARKNLLRKSVISAILMIGRKITIKTKREQDNI